MNRTAIPEHQLAWLLVSVVVGVQAYILLPELSVAAIDLNDNVLHYTLSARLVQALERGESPFDFWVSEWALGYPVPRTYQPLGHLFLALVYFALGKTVALMTLFVWTRYLLICLFPLTVYASGRLLRLQPRVAVGAALVSPLIATNGLYGLEYGSYLWRGSGLYTQAWAMHLLALTLGFAFRAVRRGHGLTVAGLLQALTFLAHFLYGYIGALSLGLLVLIPDADVPRSRRALRVGLIGLVAFSLTAFVIIPVLQDTVLINRSRWEPVWKWDSFGARQVLKLLLTGNLLDFGRLPVLSLLALTGAVVCLLHMSRGANQQPDTNDQTPRSVYIYVLVGALLWLFLFCGRATWGVLFTLLGASAELHLHRLIGAVHLFLILLAGIGLGSLWGWFATRPGRFQPAAALPITLLVLLPALKERGDFLSQNSAWGAQNLAAYEAEEKDLREVIAKAKERPGRVYPGLAAGWGGTFRVGSVPLYAFLSVHHVPAVAFLYHSMALTSDVMVRFNERNPAHYRLFNITTVLAEKHRTLPRFLTPLDEVGRFRLLAGPAAGYFDLVSVPYAVRSDKTRFYEVNDLWLQSDWVAKRQHLWLDFNGDARIDLPRLSSTQALPRVKMTLGLGAIESERRRGEIYQADVRVERDSFLLFKMTYHPNWRVTMNGERQRTAMLSPGFLGVAVSPGQYQVEVRYQPESWKTWLLGFGVLMVMLAAAAERLGLVSRAEERLDKVIRAVRNALERRTAEHQPAWLTGVGLALLALPVCVPLLTTSLPGGHDVFGYLPRLVEFHENLRYGVLLPRWAPDLSAGYGQPIFLFNPPLIYYLGELWHLLGLDVITALNMAVVTLILASGGTMFLLGSLYFGPAGGWLAATAYLFAPYFHVDLFVRRALAEFSAFPFYPLALYGFGRFAKGGGKRSLLVGAIGYAGVCFSHNAAALLFTPLLLAFVGFTAWRAHSWGVLWRQIGGVLLGLSAAAGIWLPIFVERHFVRVDRLLEGYEQYGFHFVYPQQLLYSPWGYGLSVPGYQDDMSFSLGWSHVLLIILGWVWARRHPHAADWQWRRFFVWVTLVLCGLMLPGSLWMWDHLPLLQYVHFPWRLLGPVTVGVALLIAPLGGLLAPLTAWRRMWFAGALGLLILANIGQIRPERYFVVDLANWTPEQIARRGVAVSTKREYEPRWVQRPPAFRAAGISIISGDAEIQQVSRAPIRWSAGVTARRDTLLEVASFYFPGWRVYVSGKNVPIEIAESTGLIRFWVPPGEHRVEVQFTRTWPRWIGEGLSLLAALGMVGLWWRWGRDHKGK